MADRPVLKTALCDQLGIEYPILLAGMGNASGPELAAAVANAGGLGMLGATTLTPDELRSWIRKTRTLTDKPFGVDILMPEALPKGGGAQDLRAQLPAEHVAFIEHLKQTHGAAISKGRDLPLTEDFVRSQFEVVLEEQVPIFATGLGIPDWVEREAHAQNITIISLVGSVRAAQRVKDRGADIIVAQGHEAGGHTGRIGTMALVPQVFDAVGDTPVVAAGGIGDGRGVAAALAMGACGAWVGTVFLATQEAFVDYIDLGLFDQATTDHYRQRLVDARSEDARIYRIFTGKTARALRNKFTDIWDESGMETLPMPLQWTLVADLQHGMMEKGDPEFQAFFAGQATGMIKEVKRAGDLVLELARDTVDIFAKQLPENLDVGP